MPPSKEIESQRPTIIWEKLPVGFLINFITTEFPYNYRVFLQRRLKEIYLSAEIGYDILKGLILNKVILLGSTNIVRNFPDLT